MTKLNKKWQLYLLAALTPMLIIGIVWIFNGVYPFGTKSLMSVDFGQQYIGFFGHLKDAVLSGDWRSLFYSFSKSIGGEMTASYGYYLLSPFNIIYVLLPKNQFALAGILTIWLRYGATSLAFFHLLVTRYQAMDRNRALAIVISTAYALNGFSTAYQMNPLFMDGLIMLPLVIKGVEEVLDGDAPYKYIITLALTMIIHFYFGYMICLFIVLYTIIYLARLNATKPWRDSLRSAGWSIWRMAWTSALGLGLAMVFLLPIANALSASKGGLGSTMNFQWRFQINPLDILSKLVIGPFDNSQWASGPSLPNIYVGSLAFLGFSLFFLRDKFTKAERLAALLVSGILFLSVSHEFTSQIWHMGQNPAGFFYRFSFIICFYMCLLAYRALEDRPKESAWVLVLGIGLVLFVQAVLNTREYPFLTDTQIQVTGVIWLLIMFLYYFPGPSLKWTIIAGLSLTELGVSAYLNQDDVGYDDAYRFHDAVEATNEAIDLIRPDNTDFYRIAQSFKYGFNDPMLYNYPGLIHFSSNMENATLDLFRNLGDSGQNATTNYTYPTPLTDALYGVRYYVDFKPFVGPDPNKTYTPSRQTSRKDLEANYELVAETNRMLIYENDQVLPIAFSVPQFIQGLTFETNSPATNQSRLLSVLAGDNEYKNYFETLEFDSLVTNNFSTDPGAEGTRHVFRRDNTQETGTITLTFTPETDDIYYITLPQSFNRTRLTDMHIKLNGEIHDYFFAFDTVVLTNVAYQVQGQEQVIEISSSSLNEIDLTQMTLVRASNEEVMNIIDQVAEYGLEMEEWGSNFVKGEIEIAPDHGYMLTSIPYNEGWRIKVDNEPVEGVEIVKSLLAVPMSPGRHTISMYYIPPGFYAGLTISIASLAILLLLIYLDRRNKAGLEQASEE